MKKFYIVLVGVLILMVVGCGKEKSSGPVELDFGAGAYRANWDENNLTDKAIKIDSSKLMNEFLEQHVPFSEEDKEVVNKYNEDFFKDNVIYAYVTNESSGSNQLESANAIRDGENLKLKVKRVIPQIGTMDMASRVALFELKRDDVENVTNVTVSVEDIQK
ncbi:MAG: hypothetical protein K0S34_2430 [Bacillales bacterium]|jgi:hypothetical protein|nr:hypothetical protein [Bacillales bacterium]